MVNGLYLYSAFLTSGQSNRLIFTHSCTHSHTDGGVNNARRQPARREQLGCGVLLRDTSTLARRSSGSHKQLSGYQPARSSSTFRTGVVQSDISHTHLTSVLLRSTFSNSSGGNWLVFMALKTGHMWNLWNKSHRNDATEEEVMDMKREDE